MQSKPPTGGGAIVVVEALMVEALIEEALIEVVLVVDGLIEVVLELLDVDVVVVAGIDWVMVVAVVRPGGLVVEARASEPVGDAELVSDTHPAVASASAITSHVSWSVLRGRLATATV